MRMDAQVIQQLMEMIGGLGGDDEQHKHRCPRKGCGYVWEHDPKCLVSEKQYDLAHHCPKCGAEQRMKFDGDNAAMEDNSGCATPAHLTHKGQHNELAAQFEALASQMSFNRRRL